MFNFNNTNWDADNYLDDKFPPKLGFLNIEFYKAGQRTVSSILILLTAIIFMIPIT